MHKEISVDQFMEQLEKTKKAIAAGRINDWLHITKHDGKLEGVQSLSTCSLPNPLCQLRMRNQNSVCYHCYVQNYLYRRSLIAHLLINYERLTAEIIAVERLPHFYSMLGRIESFGDIFNETQGINYVHTIEKNAGTAFAIWSKNPGIWRKVFLNVGKPRNTSFVLSSSQLNVPAVVPELFEDFVDAVFTVYSLAYLLEHRNVPIHCGFSKCLKCQICYRARREKNGRIIYVNEILKEDAAEYKKWNDAGRPAIWPAA